MFAVFLSLHLATTASATAGIGRYDATLIALRHVYRPAIPVEIALIAIPAAIHIACAVLQLLRRRKNRPTLPPFRTRIHRVSGYVLLAALGGHVLATRLTPVLGTGATATGLADFSLVAFSLVHWPVFFIPYYVVFGLAGAIHLSIGVPLAARYLGAKLPHDRALIVEKIVIVVVGAAVTAGVISIIVLAPSASTMRFEEFATVYRRWLPFMPL